MVDYVTFSIPKELVDRARPLMKKGGYKTHTEMVKDSYRRRIEELEKQERDGQ